MRELSIADLPPIDLALPGDAPKASAAPKAPKPTIARLRESHHAVARHVASGLSNAEIAAITGYTPGRISVFRADPTFMELVAHYKANVDAQYLNVHQRIGELAVDALDELKSRLDETPEEFTVGQLRELATAGLDRIGYAPVKRTENLNVNTQATPEFIARVRQAAEAKAQGRILSIENSDQGAKAPALEARGGENHQRVALLPPSQDPGSEAQAGGESPRLEI